MPAFSVYRTVSRISVNPPFTLDTRHTHLVPALGFAKDTLSWPINACPLGSVISCPIQAQAREQCQNMARVSGFRRLQLPLVSMAAAALLLLLLLLPGSAVADDSPVGAPDGLLDNGDFEEGPPDNGTAVSETGGISELPAWQISGTIEYIRADQRQGSMLLVVPEGRHAVRLGNDASLSQRLQLEQGATYSLTFSAARTCAQLESLNVSVAPAWRSVDLQTLYSIHGWDAYAFAFKAVTADAVISFHNPGLEEDPSCGPILDAIALKKLFVPELAPGNVAVNGDFEEGPFMFRNASLQLGVLLPTNPDVTTSPLPGWTVDSNRAVRFVDSDHYNVPQGRRAVELLSGKEGMIAQMVATKPGCKYVMSFLMADANDSCGSPMGVMASAGDQLVPFHLPAPPAEPNNVTFTAVAEHTRIAFYSIYYNKNQHDHSSLCGPVIDDVRVFDPSKSGAGAPPKPLVLAGSVFAPLLLLLLALL